MSEKVIDPVCGMALGPGDAVEQQIYQGRAYYFCSVGCAGKFGRAPERYVGDVASGLDITEQAHPARTKSIRDPVCGMEVEPHRNELEFEGIHYAFCSVQCRERFAANPHLYIGMPGQKAPKQEGKVVMKQRRFRTEIPLAADEAEILRRKLCAMMGVTDVTVSGREVSITYDLLQATAEQLEAKMAEIGIQIGGAWQERLRRAFVHYAEDCEVENLEVRPPPGYGIHRPN